MTVQQHINDKRRLETQIQSLDERAESSSESNADLRRRLASVQESLQVTQQILYDKQNEQIEQQQAIDDARERGIAELQRSLLKPLPPGEQDPFQSPNSQALLSHAAAGQQNPPQYPSLNQQGSMGMPMMGQMPSSYNSQMGQPNAYGQGTQYGQSTMRNPQFQP